MRDLKSPGSHSTYHYDKSWNLVSHTNNHLEQSFSVNNLNQLQNASRTGKLIVAVGYIYDARGNP